MLFWRLIARWQLRSPGQSLLCLFGVAVGIAVVVSIDLTIASATRAFALSSAAVFGRATHVIERAPLGISNVEFAQMRMAQPSWPMAPVVAGSVRAAGGDSVYLNVIGVDPISEAPFRDYLAATRAQPNSNLEAQSNLASRLMSEPGSVLATPATARSLGLKPGQRFSVSAKARTRQLRLIGTIATQQLASPAALDGVLITDIGTAQALLFSAGRISRIELRAPQGAPTAFANSSDDEQWLADLEAILPPGANLTTSAARTRSTIDMTRAFHLNLLMLSLLAMVVGVFLVFNALSYAVVRRRQQIGVLRALGMTRAQVCSLFMLEALAIGALASIVGCLAGWLLAQQLLDLVTRTMADHYFQVQVTQLEISFLTFAKALLLGSVGAALAALVPALEATQIAPRAALARSELESRVARLVPAMALIGIAGIALSMLIIRLSSSLAAAFGGLFVLLIGYAALVPIAVKVASRALAKLSSWFPSGAARSLLTHAVRSVERDLSRTGIAVAALTVAIAATIGVEVMVGSFRVSLERWLDTTLSGDIYVAAPGRNVPLDDAVVAQLTGVNRPPGVESIALSRDVEVESGVGRVYLKAVGGEFSYRELDLIAGKLEPAPASAPGLLISEPLAQHHQLAVGDRLDVSTPNGKVEHKIVAVFRDYTTERGMLMMQLADYRRLFEDQKVSVLAIRANASADLSETRRALRAAIKSDQQINVISSAEVRAGSLEIFDRTFAITHVLSLLASLTAAIAIASALTALVLERTTEYATLRVLGATRLSVGALAAGQAQVLGVLSALLAWPLGLALAAVLVFVINQRSFGWSMAFVIDTNLLLYTLLMAVLTAAAASILPVLRLARLAPARALHAD